MLASALAAPSGAAAAKVSATAPGGALADATGYYTQGPPLTQTFRLGGKKVAGKQTLDVNLTVNSTGSATGANFAFRAKLVGPGGDNFSPFPLGEAGGQSLGGLKFDDQSSLRLCNPLSTQASDCNYLQRATPGGDGVATGSVHADLNPVFRGLSPKGTWRLVWWDTSQDAKTRTTGQRPSRSGQARSTPRSRELESSDGNPFVQSFKLSGKKVQKKQVPGVNVTVNSAGSDPGANRQLRAKLISPGGDSVTVLDGPGNQSLVNLTYDDQSELQLCDPNGLEASDCNFVQGVTAPDTGFYTGFTHGFLNPVFRGGNPRGTWRLVWWDTSSVTTHEIGTATLTVRTGKKFAKR